MTVGEWIRATREALGWSQADLSYETRIDVRLIGRYERGEGKPSQENLDKILIALHRPPPWEETGPSDQPTGRYPGRPEWPMPEETFDLVPA